MAERITYDDKVQAQAQPNPPEELWRAPDANEVKDKFNLNADDIEANETAISLIQTELSDSLIGSVNVISSRDLAATDVDNVLLANSASDITLAIPPFATIPIPVGKSIFVQKINTGRVIVNGVAVTTRGITNGTPSNYEVELLDGVIGLIHISENVWTIVGNQLVG